MKIKNNKINYTSFLLIISVLVILFLVSFSIGGNENKKDKKTKTEKLDIETKTQLNTTFEIIDIIKKEVGIIHQDSICTIYLYRELETPILLYVYKDSLNFRQRTDLFSLHVFLKDPSNWRKTHKSFYIGFPYKETPFELTIDKSRYFVFRKTLGHEFIEYNNISKINTGRFLYDVGPSYYVKNIKISIVPEINISNNLKKIIISIKNKGFEKLKTKREEAFHNRILITEPNDFIDAEIDYMQSQKLKAKLRLKGDWIDHLKDPKKWSFRLIMNDGNTVNGLRKFSIQHPKTRNYLWEWLFNKSIIQNDIIGIKYEFVNVDLNIIKKDTIQEISLGIMAFEEAFDKILIERNKRREGIILAFDESLIWEDRNQVRELGLESSQKNDGIQSFRNSPIKLYNESKVLSDPKLVKQFKIAQDLLIGLQKGKLKVSEAFDIDKLTMFVALSNLFGGYHGLVGHNMKIYFNPVTNKLEPISWDSNSGIKIEQIHNYWLSKGDNVYTEKLIEKLELVSSTTFINNLVNSFKEDLNKLSNNLNSEFDNSNLDLSILEYNSNVIKKSIYPSNAIVTGLLNFDTNQMNLSIKNISDFPIIINSLVHKDGKTLSKPMYDNIISSKSSKKITFQLKESFVNAFVSKKNKKGEFRYPKDLSKMMVQFNMFGQKHRRTERIIPFSKSENLEVNLTNYKNSFYSNLKAFEFIRVNEAEKTIKFKAGSYQFNETLVIPSGYIVSIEKGFRLNFKNQASIVSYSAFTSKGTREKPIKFYSSDATGAGIFISSAPEISIFDYCEFSNLSNPTSNIWELSGAVNFNETTVAIKNSLFENNRCEDGLNIIRSKFTLESSIFKDTKSDAFDGDFVEGSITNCEFINSGNDGVDVSGSKITLENITFENPLDKAISAGENSTINGSEIIIEGGEIGIVSKDLSRVTLSEVTISDTRLGFSSFQKKSEFGPGTITITDLTTTNIESDYLVEIGSSLTINGLLATTVSNKVIDQMYGKEYGKSSK